MKRPRRIILAVGGLFCGAFLIGVMHRNAGDAPIPRRAVASPTSETATRAEPPKPGGPSSPSAARDAPIVSPVGDPPADWGRQPSAIRSPA